MKNYLCTAACSLLFLLIEVIGVVTVLLILAAVIITAGG